VRTIVQRTGGGIDVRFADAARQQGWCVHLHWPQEVAPA